MSDPTPRPGLSTVTIGALCGIAAATCWGAGFVAAKHGIVKGLAPTDLAFHRFVWSGLLLMPLVARAGLGDLGGVGWPRGLVILLLAGPLQAITSYTGFTLAPLGHGAVIHPASAALGGTLLAYLVLGEPLTRTRIVGVAGIVLGLIVFAGEAITTLGGGAPLGDAAVYGLRVDVGGVHDLPAQMANQRHHGRAHYRRLVAADLCAALRISSSASTG